jgi:hypothetical protein
MDGFWVGLGIFLMGLCIGNGLNNIAKAVLWKRGDK